ncbi:hypothetical protein BBK14_01820 [Parafrankia soli]|uniref:Uncharacterized protein n=1 Tax=Parafrankia soli TaxID=2599596 RepID=A0A1S1RK44_9ACTN|nr:hypothetical protein [Parafrankia soli]OHV46610.1 hypothetical protein BBK14_01820 [Parafrankia soli]
MTPDEAAQRTGLAPRDITGVAEHPLGHVVTTRDSGPLLVTDTVVRRYVPEVDDEPVRATEPDDSAAAAAPAPRGRPRKAD